MVGRRISAKSRLQRELEKISRGDFMISSCTYVGPRDDDIYNWEATLMGPDDSPYEGGVFHLTFRFPRNYPLEPPEVLFKTQIFHPNIDREGHICLWKDCDWTPATHVTTILVNIHSRLKEPEVKNALMPEITHMYLNDLFRYEMMARCWTHKYAKGSLLV